MLLTVPLWQDRLIAPKQRGNSLNKLLFDSSLCYCNKVKNDYIFDSKLILKSKNFHEHHFLVTGVYTANHRDDFLAEISLLIHLGEHENILSVKGVCTTSSFTDDDNESLSPLLVTEYMIYGDLLHFLWTSRDVSLKKNCGCAD